MAVTTDGMVAYFSYNFDKCCFNKGRLIRLIEKEGWSVLHPVRK